MDRQIECASVDFHGRPSNEARLSGSKSVSKDGIDLEVFFSQNF